MKNRFFSIDASTNSLAFAVFEDSSLISYGKINFFGNNVYDKVADAARKSIAFFGEFPDVDNLIIEHTVFMNSPKTAADLALVQGALLGAAAQAGIKLAGAVNPITWQSYLGNKRLTKEEQFKITQDHPGKTKSWYKKLERDMRKQRTIKLIEINYDRQVTDDDVADAIGIGHYAHNNWDKVVDKNG
jgi:hypothetical protein